MVTQTYNDIFNFPEDNKKEIDWNKWEYITIEKDTAEKKSCVLCCEKNRSKGVLWWTCERSRTNGNAYLQSRMATSAIENLHRNFVAKRSMLDYGLRTGLYVQV